MSEHIIAILKRKLDDLAPHGEMDAETLRNVFKEELQFYVLNFIYHHPQYNKWVMYGGSALRIIHGLDRMSVDLDFTFDNTYMITGGDVWPDNIINSLDIALLISIYSTASTLADLNRDGFVNAADIALIIKNYHKKGGIFFTN